MQGEASGWEGLAGRMKGKGRLTEEHQEAH